MKTRIGFFAMAFVLLAFANAHSGDQPGPIGPSCKSNYMNLPISDIPQKFGTSWCWAATAQNVMDFHGKKIEQCELVATVYSEFYSSDETAKTACCGDTPNECWGQGGYPEWVFDRFQFSSSPSKARSNNLTWENATEEICQKRPFISSLDMLSGDRHSVVITGYSVARGVRIYDPTLNDFVWEKYAEFFEDQSLDYQRIRDTYKIHPDP